MSLLGRPRDPTVDEAAMSAAIDLIMEGGYPNLTMNRIAVRAAVSKAALYRRWPNKLSLVVDAIETFAHTQTPVPDSGAVREDIAAYLQTYIRAKRDQAETFAALSDALTSDPELGERCRDTLLAGMSANFQTIVARGVQRGELPQATDVELLANVIPALIRYQHGATGKPLDDAFIARLADQFFASTAPRPRGRRPRGSTRRRP
jgi:AcrR family transcriptional regulator